MKQCRRPTLLVEGAAERDADDVWRAVRASCGAMTWAGLAAHPRGLLIVAQRSGPRGSVQITSSKFFGDVRTALSEAYRDALRLAPCMTDAQYRAATWLRERGSISLSGKRSVASDAIPMADDLFATPEEPSTDGMVRSLVYEIANHIEAEHHARYATLTRPDGTLIHRCGPNCAGGVYGPDRRILFRGQYVADDGTLWSHADADTVGRDGGA